MTPIGMAAIRGSLAIVDTFLSARSSYSVSELLQSTCGIENSSLLHLAVESGSTDTVVYLLHKSIRKRCTDAEGFTALHVACRMGHVPVIQQLIYSDSWLINAPSCKGSTPLHEAARHDQVTAIRFLLDKGASIDALTSTGAPPLLFAASFGAHKTVKEFLARSVDYMKRDEDGVNVLHCAVGHTKTLRVLANALENHPGFAELVSASDNNGATALHYASQYGHSSDVDLLVKLGAKLDAVNQNGATPLHLAAKRGHCPMVARLSCYAPRLLNAVDGCGRTPLHIASLYGHSKVLSNCLMNGAVLMHDCDGRTPFHCAAWNGSTKCLKALLSAFPDDHSSKDSEKATALHLAVAANNPDVVTLLLDKGVLIDVDNEAGLNCLDVAIANEFEDCVSVIVNHERWRESMKPLLNKSKAETQLQLLVQTMPEQALVIMDKCIESSEENSQQTQSYDFSYMLGVTDKNAQIQSRAPRQLLETMVKFNRSSCLAHPLCVEFLNVMWMKFVAAIVVLNLGLYITFLISLMIMVIYFPAYSPHPLEHEDSIKRLLSVLQHAQERNRTTLTSHEKFDLCYGDNDALRQSVVLATVLCLLKEILPIWFIGREYFKRSSNMCEIIVYGLTLFFLDPFGLFLDPLAIPKEPCPKIVWEVAAITVFLGWIVLIMNFRRLPHVGIYIVMIVSMVITMIQVVIVAALFILGFGFAFYMLMNTEALFSSGGLSLMRMVTMAVGDFAYDDILPVSDITETANLSVYYDQLRNVYGNFDFIKSLPLPNTTAEINNAPRADCSINETATGSYTEVDSNDMLLLSSFLSYIFFISFALLMPIVVLNVLIGLAVGDIEAVRTDAALRQIRMQIKLLVELETALPAWFLNRVHVVSSCRVPEKKSYFRGMVRRVMRAADEPTAKGKSTAAGQLAEVKRNVRDTKEWLANIERGLEQQLMMLKTLAACIKRQRTQLPAPQSALDQDNHLSTKVSADPSVSKGSGSRFDMKEGSELKPEQEGRKLPREETESDDMV